MNVEEFKERCRLIMGDDDFDFVFSKVKESNVEYYYKHKDGLSKIINSFSWSFHDDNRCRNICDKYLELNTMVNYSHLSTRSLYHTLY
jgi:hypothetical protein